jgi:hypothetical protein
MAIVEIDNADIGALQAISDAVGLAVADSRNGCFVGPPVDGSSVLA